LRRGDEAAALLRLNISRHLRHRDSLMALATMERDSGNLRLAAEAAALQPSDREAAALLMQLRGLRQ
jgi:hypothetical protein